MRSKLLAPAVHKSAAFNLLLAGAWLLASLAPASAAPVAQTSGDDATPEIGVEWVNVYGGNNLKNTDDDAEGLHYFVGTAGYAKRFNYGNRLAWEEDWKASARGGTEATVVDSVDLAYFSGHGGRAFDPVYGKPLSALVFGEGGNTRDDAYLVPGDARLAWGDGDLEWVGLSACQVLSDESRDYWANTMNGLHLILGFKTNTFDTDHGRHFGERLRWGWTLRQAWFGAADASQFWSALFTGQKVVARVLAEEPCHFNDTLKSSCGDRVADKKYYAADHAVGYGVQATVDPATLNYQMPRAPVIASTPNETDLRQLQTIFGIATNTPVALDGSSNVYHTSDGARDLAVDKQGRFQFLKLNELWLDGEPTAALPATSGLHAPLAPLTEAQAKQSADAFLNANKLMPDDAAFVGVLTDTLSVVQTSENALGLAPEAGLALHSVVTDTPSNAQQVLYARQLVYTPTSGTPITFPVVGPGASLKVYVNNSGQVIGSLGRWRTIARLSPASTTTILTTSQALALYQALGDQLNLAPSTFSGNVYTITKVSVGYYERGLGENQSSLMPVYMLGLLLGNSNTGAEAESVAYVPATPNTLPPLVKIATADPTSPYLVAGEAITLTAADATLPLAEQGYAPNLNFALGQGPYSYTWTLQSSGTVIGTERVLQYVPSAADNLGTGKANTGPLVIVLRVTDATGRSSQVSRSYSFLGETPTIRHAYLPIILK